MLFPPRQKAGEKRGSLTCTAVTTVSGFCPWNKTILSPRRVLDETEAISGLDFGLEEQRLAQGE